VSVRARPTTVRIGCAGWSIPSQHAHLFGEGDSHLSRYATRFDVVEINSTFYRPHLPHTFERWAASVPSRFRFSVKLPKAITHDARLHGTGDALSAFLDATAGLGSKLGGVLVQLPPSLAFDARLADRFFAMLRRRCAVGIACEPRHASWFGAAADRVWMRYAIARAAADPATVPEAALPAAAKGAARWSYWRWHGAPRMYYSRYEDDDLRHLARALAREGRVRAPSWCILDNTAHGHAMADAARLQDFISACKDGKQKSWPAAATATLRQGARHRG
jgi:uncharacterized protein YecE (DUF72 family)